MLLSCPGRKPMTNIQHGIADLLNSGHLECFDHAIGETMRSLLIDARELTVSWDRSEESDTPITRDMAVCDYCAAAPATGYVHAYRSHVCRECYNDHHGS